MNPSEPFVPARRSPWMGVRQVLAFNWHWYLAGVAGAILGYMLLHYWAFPEWFRIPAGLLLALGLFWMAGSIAASYWLYDKSFLHQWDWLKKMLPQASGNWVNIHAGFDEWSPALEKCFPAARGVVLDIYNPLVMTERSIAKARKRNPNPVPGIPADFENLPVPDASQNFIFLFFAAHELRQHETRRSFFEELHRIAAISGQLVIVEQIRNWANFAAFGPGAFHFHSRSDWLLVTNETGWVLKEEKVCTPFARIFRFEKRA